MAAAVSLGDPSFGETLRVVRTTTAEYDDYGDLIPGTGVETRTPVEGCAVAPLKDGEDQDVDGVRIVDGWSVYLPFGTDLVASDLVEVRGVDYHVDGVPGVWVNPYSPAHPRGVEVVVRRS
jgi:hypothetical protein